MAEQSTANSEEGRPKKAASEDSGKKKCPTCKKGTPLWFISWADMVTLLLCLFVIIVAYSTTEKGQFLTLAGSMRDAFGSKYPDESMPPIARGYHLVNMQFQAQITLVHIADQIRELLAPLVETRQAAVTNDDDGVTVLIDRDVLYQPGSSALQDRARALMEGVATIITLLPNTVEVRAARSETAGKPFEWEAGTADAAAVAAVFEQQGGILYNRIQVTSLVAPKGAEPGGAAHKDKIEIRINKTTNPEE
ncbi:MAG: hypothetical protein H7838_10935 [Magnetococcus sp. DMHC-8]